MLRVFGQTLPIDCVEGTQCFEDYLRDGLEPWRNDHGTTIEPTAEMTTDPVLIITLSPNNFSMEVNEAKMAIYILSGCIFSLRKLVHFDVIFYFLVLTVAFLYKKVCTLETQVTQQAQRQTLWIDGNFT